VQYLYPGKNNPIMLQSAASVAEALNPGMGARLFATLRRG
jgi:hypothetical protein